jgi:glucokinase
MKNLALGIDLGGTNTRIALINREGHIKIMEEFPTRSEQSGDSIIWAISKKIDAILEKKNYSKNRILGIGLGSAGFISSKKGIISFSPNLPTLSNFPISERLESLTGLKTILENDANAAGIGEHWLGRGKGINNFIFITLGTGLGSGIILNGNIWHGTQGFAGEFGHTTLYPNGLPCKCGRRGCLEVYCSASAIVRTARILLKRGIESCLRIDNNPLTSHMIYEHAYRGDQLACDIFRKTGTYLGIALSNVFNLLDLEMAIIGGKVAEAGELILKSVRDEVEKRSISARDHPPQILQSKLGNNAGVIGAASLVFSMRSTDCRLRDKTANP